MDAGTVHIFLSPACHGHPEHPVLSLSRWPTMPTMPTIARGAGGILKNVLKNDLEFLVLYLLLISLSSIPISVGILIGVLRRGRDTQFSDSNPRLGFTPGPSTRGTMNIVWLCMSTIFTCVYVSVHIDVRDKDKVGAFANMLEDSARGSTDEHSPSPDDLPPPMSYTPSNDVEKVSDDAPDDKLDGDSSSVDRNSISTPEIHIPLPRLLRRGCAALWRFFAHAQCRRIFWMLFNVFAPELVVFVAVLERISASDGVQFMRERKQKWNVQLAFFADMGGFEIAEGTFVGRKGKLTKTKRFRNGLQLMKWVTKYDVHFKADILAKQIDDRCKANRVLKVFTCTQAAWLFVETILRLVQKKPVSELEVATCSYIFCTLITYCCWMHKPYDVHHSITIRQEWLMRPDRVASDATAIEVQGGPIDSEIKTAGQVEDTERSQTKLPSMIYPQARFTPFNRAYRHPGHSWRCTYTYLLDATTYI